LKGWREVMAAAAWNGSGIAALEASTGCLDPPPNRSRKLSPWAAKEKSRCWGKQPAPALYFLDGHRLTSLYRGRPFNQAVAYP